MEDEQSKIKRPSLIMSLTPLFNGVCTDHGNSWKSHLPGLESPRIRPTSWKVVEMRIAGVTDYSMISLNDYLDGEEFWPHPVLVAVANLCIT